MADKAYDTQDIREGKITEYKRCYSTKEDTEKSSENMTGICTKLVHLVENAFLHLKRRRGIATHYAKNTRSFIAAIQIRSMMP